MRPPLTALSTRAEQQNLPGAGDEARLRDLLLAEAHDDTWRIVELFSVRGRPFEVELAWSAGCGAGARAEVSVAQATRVGIYARTVRVRARNLGSEPNLVGVTIADGQANTRNQGSGTGELVADVPTVLAVPPFARAARLDLADVAAVATSELLLVDADGTTRARIPAASQPDAGVLVGAAREVHVLTSTSSAFRLVFDLTL